MSATALGTGSFATTTPHLPHPRTTLLKGPVRMADRAVYRTAKDQFGNIVGLWGEFGVVSHTDAISDIELGVERYFVPMDGGTVVPIAVNDGPYGKYLRANWDGRQRNNLVDLPDA